MPSVNDTRRAFLDYFGARAHTVMPSARTEVTTP